jgi:hypothetical protein
MLSMLVTGPKSMAPTEMLDFKKALRRISTMFALGGSTNNDFNSPRMADPNRASRLSLAAVSASSRSRSSSPGGRKLSRSIQMPYRSAPDPLALEPTEPNREKRNSRPPSPPLAPSPLNTGFAATLDSLPTRRKWLPRSRNASEERKTPHRSSAWLITGEGHQDYDLSRLRDSARVRALERYRNNTSYPKLTPVRICRCQNFGTNLATHTCILALTLSIPHSKSALRYLLHPPP